MGTVNISFPASDRNPRAADFQKEGSYLPFHGAGRQSQLGPECLGSGHFPDCMGPDPTPRQYVDLILGLVAGRGPSFQASHPGSTISKGKTVSMSGDS